MDHDIYMQQALTLAELGRGRTSPNPLVGAIIVNNGSIVGTGWHHEAGTPHAEIHALHEAGNRAQGSTIYVTLEPCCYYGRTGPCVKALIEAGVKTVVAAMADPNPQMSGRGFAMLRSAGIQVIEGVMAYEAAKQNDIFVKWIVTRQPFVALKTAMTMDGKIATRTGHSRWITGPEARQFVHRLRDQYDGILVGINTVLVDNPQLTVRLADSGKNPVRIILDSHARTPVSAHVINDGQAPTIIVVSPAAPQNRIDSLRRAGAEILTIPQTYRGLDLSTLLKQLGKRTSPITSILVEGGAAVNGSFLECGLVDKVHCFIAPKLVGGYTAPTPVGGEGVANMDKAIELVDPVWTPVGVDMLLTAYIKRREG